jgi:foldase protein PrsA
MTAAVTGCGGGDGGIASNAVAKVGDSQISKTDYDKNVKFQNVLASQQFSLGKLFKDAKPHLIPFREPYTECIQAVKKQVPKGQKATTSQLKGYCVNVTKQIKEGAITQLVSAKILEGEAKSDKLTVTDKEIDKQLPALLTQYIGGKQNLPKFTALTGQGDEPFRELVKANLLGQKFQAKVAKEAGPVTDADVQAFYNKNKAQYTQPESRDLHIVLTKTEAKAQQAKKALEGGKDFAAVAKQYSQDSVTKKAGGKLAGVTKGQQEKALETAAFGAKKGALVGPVKTETGYYIVRVDKVTASKVVPFAQVKAQIKQQLTTQKPQEAQTKWQTDVLKRWKAKTDCRKGYIVQLCKNAPKATTTGATPAAQ